VVVGERFGGVKAPAYAPAVSSNPTIEAHCIWAKTGCRRTLKEEVTQATTRPTSFRIGFVALVVTMHLTPYPTSPKRP
jgi:hypothetical protein